MNFDQVRSLIRSVPDYPRPGILFQDITPVLEDSNAFSFLVDQLAASARDNRPTKIAGVESRGFIFAAPLAKELGAGLVLIRKKGKLPAPVFRESYSLEYGTDEMEVHQDSLSANDRVMIVDDVLATGGTANAAIRLCQRAGAEVLGFRFVIELVALSGRSKLEDFDVFSVFHF